MSVRAVSTDELTGYGPIAMFAPTIADACLGCGALLAACFAHRGALVVTTLGATAPAWMSRVPNDGRPVATRAPWSVTALDAGPCDEPRRGRLDAGKASRRVRDPDSLAPLEALGGSASSTRTLSADTGPRAAGSLHPDSTAHDIAELCSTLGVRSLFLPSIRHRSSRHAGIVEAAAARVRGEDDRIRCWRYPTGMDRVFGDHVADPLRPIRTYDTTPWREAKRDALLCLCEAGFELPPARGCAPTGHDSADRLAARLTDMPERYVRDPVA